ncbi:MAG: hypothetical protein WEI16_07110 [Chloroflexota bacterium]
MAEVPLTNQLMRDALFEMIGSSLNSLDAVIAAVARKLAEDNGLEPHLITYDKRFKGAPRLHLWGLK